MNWNHLELFITWFSPYTFRIDHDEASEPSEEAKDGHHEGYRDRDLPQGYTPYKQNVNADEYDRYEYEHGESPLSERIERKPCQELKSCCSNIGRLVSSFHGMKLWKKLCVSLGNPRTRVTSHLIRTFNYNQWWVQSIYNSILIQQPWVLVCIVLSGMVLNPKRVM